MSCYELLDVYDLYLFFQAALWHHVFGKSLIHVIEHGCELPIEICITRQGEDVVPCHRIESGIVIRIEEDKTFRFAGSREKRAKPELVSRPRREAENGILAAEFIAETIILMVLMFRPRLFRLVCRKEHI